MNGEDLPLIGSTPKVAALDGSLATAAVAQDPSAEAVAQCLKAALLPQAPLAMPKQQLEYSKGPIFGRVLAMFGARKTGAQG